ncbi:isochorismate synthase [Aquipuribacter nitratireducens]|uniref:isochorismate synthase n=1 Tax=Aquipuribacter nitratireducens TaxID=650104 RepID=A0ABW0GMC9_9MICO
MSTPLSSPAQPAERPATTPRPAGRLVSRTVGLDDPGPLLDLLPPGDAEPLAWVRRGEGLVGWGRAARIRTSGPDRFADAERRWRELLGGSVVRDEVRLRGTGPVAFGSFAFADASASESVLEVPETVVGHRDGRWWLTRTTVQAPGARAAAELPGPVEAPAPHGRPEPPRDVTFADGSVTSTEWELLVAAAVARIGRGDVDKVVLARDLLARASAPLDVRSVLQRLAAAYPATWTFHVDGLVGATPEMLVRTHVRLVASRVLAGTIRRTGDDEHDLALAASLARSSKDLGEHEYAVRSVVEALEPFCAGTNVPESPFVLHLANVMHLATDVTGVLRDGVSSLRLAAALHPSAAVCGTPTGAAAGLIADLEGMDRGRYAGPVGWLDADGDGEWGIALRCGQLGDDATEVRLFAGCGIVDGSDPAAELAESTAKLVPMRDALGG